MNLQKQLRAALSPTLSSIRYDLEELANKKSFDEFSDIDIDETEKRRKEILRSIGF